MRVPYRRSRQGRGYPIPGLYGDTPCQVHMVWYPIPGPDRAGIIPVYLTSRTGMGYPSNLRLDRVSPPGLDGVPLSSQVQMKGTPSQVQVGEEGIPSKVCTGSALSPVWDTPSQVWMKGYPIPDPNEGYPIPGSRQGTPILDWMG